MNPAQERHPFYVFIGTKAQYIKTAPLLRLMQNKNIPYFLIDSGQHAEFAPQLRRELGVKDPDIHLQSKGNIKSVFEAVIWLSRYLLLLLFRPGYLRRTYFPYGKGICIVHGDTPSTLLAVLMAKRSGMIVAHIEAGLRSYNLFRPFPEEIVRIITMRMSDILFAPTDWSFENIEKMKLKGAAYNIGQNTNVEALYYAFEQNRQRIDGVQPPYCVMTMHRVETILNKKKLRLVIDLAGEIARDIDLVFVMHDPTKERLVQNNMMWKLEENSRIKILPLIDHSLFVNLLVGSEFVITDGGSIQEECSYLDVPCLVMRGETERQEGIGSNVLIGKFEREPTLRFSKEYKNYKRGYREKNMQPSNAILETLLSSTI